MKRLVHALCRALVRLLDTPDGPRARLRGSEARLASVLESAPEAMLVIDADGRIVLANQQAEATFGYRRDELLGAPIEALVPQSMRDVHRRHRAGYQTQPSMRPMRGVRVSGRRKDGSEFPAEVSLSALAMGEATAVTAVIRDISDRRRAEAEHAALVREQTARAEAEAAHRRMAFLAEASTVLSASLDYEATLTSVSRLVVPYLADWCAIHLVREDGTLDQLTVVHDDPARERFARDWCSRHPVSASARWGVPHVIRTGKPELWPILSDAVLQRAARTPEELVALRGLGLRSVVIVPLTTRDRILGAVTLVTAESGRVYGHDDLVLADDLARRAALAVENARLFREAEAARAHAETASQRLRSLGSITATALAHLTLDDLFADVLGQITRALGVDTAVILLVEEGERTLTTRAVRGVDDDPRGLGVPVGEGFAGRIAGERRAMIVPDVQDADVRGTGIRAELRSLLGMPLLVGDTLVGVLHVGTLAPRHFTDADAHLLQAVGDRVALAIDRATLYQAERRARREAEAANRMKDEFLATVSHELRTPLTAILGWARLLRSPRYGLPCDALGPLETIERNARAQTRLVDDLLDVSRIITGRLHLDLRPTDLGGVVDAALDAVRPAAVAKGIALDATLDPSATPVLADAGRLQQVVWNLLTNAVKFTPDGGRVTLHARGHGMHAHVVVRDTGKGIAPEFLPYIFDRFRQEDSTPTRTHGGLGLGLAIVRHLVEMHGGTVHAESAGEGRGTTFTVTVPLAPDAARDRFPDRPGHAPVGPAPDLEPAPVSLAGSRVLVVDDEADSRETVAAMLSDHGADVVTAASASEALRVVQASRPDILVADIGMPGVDGYDLIRAVRALPSPHRTVAAIAVTAYARAEDRERALAAGYDAHMPKPVEPTGLATLVASFR
jgi:PAS domain S-box-containing protein